MSSSLPGKPLTISCFFLLVMFVPVICSAGSIHITPDARTENSNYKEKTLIHNNLLDFRVLSGADIPFPVNMTLNITKIILVNSSVTSQTTKSLQKKDYNALTRHLNEVAQAAGIEPSFTSKMIVSDNRISRMLQNQVIWVNPSNDYAASVDDSGLVELLSMSKLDSVNELSEMTSLKLQMAMDRRSKFIETLSNIMGKISNTSETLAANIK